MFLPLLVIFTKPLEIKGDGSCSLESQCLLHIISTDFVAQRSGKLNLGVT